MSLSLPTLTTSSLTYKSDWELDTPSQADGSNLTSLTDSQGGFTLSNLSVAPIYHTADYPPGGRPCMTCTGTASQGMQAATASDWTFLHNGTAWGIALMFRINVFTTSGSYILLDTSNNGAGSGVRIQYNTTNTALQVTVFNGTTAEYDHTFNGVITVPNVHGLWITFDGNAAGPTCTVSDWDGAATSNTGGAATFASGAPNQPITFMPAAKADFVACTIVKGALPNATDQHAIMCYHECKWHTAGNVTAEYLLDTGNIYASSGVSLGTVAISKQGVISPAASAWDFGQVQSTVVKFGAADYRQWQGVNDSTGNTNDAYQTSSDGITWTKPTLNIVSYGGNSNNNLIGVSGDYLWGTYVYDVPASSILVKDTFGVDSNGTSLDLHAPDSGGLYWVIDTGSFTIQSGTAESGSTGVQHRAVIDAGKGDNSGTVQIKASNAEDALYGILLRFVDGSNYFLFGLAELESGNNTVLYEVNGGSFISRGTIAGVYTANSYYTVTWSLNGTALSVSITDNVGTKTINYTISGSYAGATTSSKVGLRGGGTGQWKSFECDTLTGTYSPTWYIRAGETSHSTNSLVASGSLDGINGWSLMKQIESSNTVGRGGFPIIKANGKLAVLGHDNAGGNGRSAKLWLASTANPSSVYTSMGEIPTLTSSSSTAQFVTPTVYKLGPVWLGFVPRYNGTTNTQSMDLWVSRDEGFSWYNTATPYIPFGAGAAFDSKSIDSPSFVRESTTERIFYSGSSVDHTNVLNGQIGYATLSRGRIGTAGTTGTITHRAMYQPVADVNAVFVNVDASGGGSLTAAVLDASGNIIGSLDDAHSSVVAINAPDPGVQILWAGHGLPTGQPFRVRLTLTSATLYSWAIAPILPVAPPPAPPPFFPPIPNIPGSMLRGAMPKPSPIVVSAFFAGAAAGFALATAGASANVSAAGAAVGMETDSAGPAATGAAAPAILGAAVAWAASIAQAAAAGTSQGLASTQAGSAAQATGPATSIGIGYAVGAGAVSATAAGATVGLDVALASAAAQAMAGASAQGVAVAYMVTGAITVLAGGIAMGFATATASGAATATAAGSALGASSAAAVAAVTATTTGWAIGASAAYSLSVSLQLVPAAIWTEPTRGIVWRGPAVMSLVKREGEKKTYAYDFLNDPVIQGGDTIASFTSLAVETLGPTGAAQPTIVTPPSYPGTGTRVFITLSGGQDDAKFQYQFSVTTAGGSILVGEGILVVNDDQ